VVPALTALLTLLQGCTPLPLISGETLYVMVARQRRLDWLRRTDIDAKFPIGSTVRGVVSRLANFGAFVKLAPGVEGLVHISELSNVRVSQVSKVVQEGQEVEVKVLTVDRENQKIGLSLKAAQAPPPKAEVKEEVEEPVRKPAIKKRPGPLKGGFDRGDDAKKIGLSW